MVVHSDYLHDNRVRREAETLLAQGFSVKVIAASIKPAKKKLFLHNGIDIEPVALTAKNGKLRFIQMMYKCGRRLQKTDATVIHAHDLDALTASLLFYQPYDTQKIIYDSHELYTETHSVYNRKVVKAIWTFLEANCIKRAHKILTVSDGIASYLMQRYQLKEFPVVLRNFTSLPESENTKIDTVNFNLPATKRIGIYQGVLQKGRGLELLLDGISQSDWGLIICGDGPLEMVLKQQVKNLGIESKVLFTGKIDPSQINELMKLCDAGFILTQPEGLSHEFSLPNKLTEYIHAGLPLITTELPEISKLVNSYEIGRCINNEQELVSTLSNFPSKSEFQEKLKTASLELNWENEKKKLLNLYSELFSKK